MSIILEQVEQHKFNLSDMRIFFFDQEINVNQNLGKTIISASANGKALGRLNLISSAETSVAFEMTTLSEGHGAVVAALLKSLVNRFSLENLNRDMELVVFTDDGDAPLLSELGFERTSTGTFTRKIDFLKARAIAQIKSLLEAQTIPENKIGAGYSVNLPNSANTEIDLLMTEYNEVAWGTYGWAKQSAIAQDEVLFIKEHADPFARVAEIGCGNGRLTEYLTTFFGHVTGTDYSPQIINSFYHRIKNSPIRAKLSLVVDDITNTKLPPQSFDKILFLENGLGGILSYDGRKNVLLNIYNALKPNGKLLLGVRNLGPASCDQLMLAQQTHIFMGVYHTFSQGEILDLASGLFKIMHSKVGDPRPAGGQQYFFELRKI